MAQITSIDPSAVTAKDPETKLRGPENRISQFSYIRVTACFAIVLLHCINAARVYHEPEISPAQVNASFTAISVLMWAVPCFLMVTGSLLLDPARSLPASKLFGKYIRRILTALVVFTLIFTLIRHESGSGTGILPEFIDGLLFNHCMAYLWYLYLMLALYLLMPFFRMITARASDRQLLYIVSAMLLISSVLPLGAYAGIDAAAYIPTQIVYAAYLFIGYLLFRHTPDAKISSAVFVICTIALAYITHTLTGTDIDPAGLNSYNSPLVVLQSAAVFSLMLHIKRSSEGIIESIDRCTFGIYLIHMIFVRLTMKEMGVNLFIYGPPAFIAAAALFFAASYAVTFLLKKIRFMDFL